MNQFYYEHRAKEKVRELLQEGQRSQAFHRSGAQPIGLFSRLRTVLIRALGRGSSDERSHRSTSKTETIQTEYGD